MRHRLLRRLRLHVAVLEHRLDDEIASGEVGIVGARRDAGEQRVAFVFGGAAALDRLRRQLRRNAPCPSRRKARSRSISTTSMPAMRRDIGDAGAHEAGADHAELADRAARLGGGTPRALVELLLGDEERADHRRRLFRREHMREVAALHFQRRVHRQLQPLEGGLQQIARRPDNCRRSPCGRARWPRARAGSRRARTPAPRLPADSLSGPRASPAFSPPASIASRASTSSSRGAIWSTSFIGERLLRRRCRSPSAGTPARACASLMRRTRWVPPAPGKMPIFTSGSAIVVALSSAMTRPCAASASSVAPPMQMPCDADDERLAAGLQPPVEPRHAAGFVEEAPASPRRVASRRSLEGAESRPWIMVMSAPAQKSFLPETMTAPLIAASRGDLLDDRLQLVHRRQGEDVHGAARHVQGDERDPVLAGLEAEILVASCESPRHLPA